VFRLVSLNLNGIRSAATKGLLPWAEAIGADCMGVQEIKAQQADVAGRFDRCACPSIRSVTSISFSIGHLVVQLAQSPQQRCLAVHRGYEFWVARLSA